MRRKISSRASRQGHQKKKISERDFFDAMNSIHEQSFLALQDGMEMEAQNQGGRGRKKSETSQKNITFTLDNGLV